MTKMRDGAGLLAEGWYAVARSDEVGAKRPLGRVVMEEPLVLYRTRRGRIAALEDRCAHRNAKLSEGDVFDDRIGCPYHGWTYDEVGRCVHVPSRGPSDRGLPIAECQLGTFATVERYGLVWVWMGRGAPSGEPFAMPYWDTPGWSAYYMTTRFENGVTNLVENFMDVPHTVFVHRGWFRSRAQRKVRTTVERTDASVLVTYHEAQDSIGFSSRVLNPSGAPMVHTDKFYMPNVTRVDYEFGADRAFVITSTCTPVRPFETLVYTLISYKMGALGPLARLFLPAYTREVIRQDVVIARNQGENLQRYGEPRFRSTAADIIHEHIEALREWAERGGVGPRPEPRVDEVDLWI